METLGKQLFKYNPCIGSISIPGSQYSKGGMNLNTTHVSVQYGLVLASDIDRYPFKYNPCIGSILYGFSTLPIVY